MEVRADFARREVVRPTDQTWHPASTTLSSETGIEQCLLHRTVADPVRDTAFVRHAPGARLDKAAAGEELVVLDGSVSDAAGDYRAGTYMRDPSGNGIDRCAGPDGALLFVKRNQFATADRRRVVIDIRAARFRPGPAPGMTVLPLHDFGDENTALVRWAPSTRFTLHRHWGGEEMLVLEGVFEDEHGAYPTGTWIRNPHLSTHDPFIKVGALVYVKTGHLPVR